MAELTDSTSILAVEDLEVSRTFYMVQRSRRWSICINLRVAVSRAAQPGVLAQEDGSGSTRPTTGSS